MHKVKFSYFFLFILHTCLNVAQCQEETKPVLEMLYIEIIYFA